MRRVSLLPVLFMTGCALHTAGHQVDQAWLDDAVWLGSEELSGHSAQSVAKPWLVGAAVPLKKQSAVPVALRSTQTFSLSLEEPLPGLDELGRRLSLLSDLQLSISPEARLPLSHFLPRLNTNEEGVEPVPRGGLVFEQLRLPDLLNQIAAVYSLSWRFQAGRIELYRTETRRFVLPFAKRVEAVAAGQAALGAREIKTTQAQTERGRISYPSAAYVQEVAEAFLSRAGSVRVLGEPPDALLVTDTPARLNVLGQALEQQPELWGLDKVQEGTTVGKGAR